MKKDNEEALKKILKSTRFNLSAEVKLHLDKKNTAVILKKEETEACNNSGIPLKDYAKYKGHLIQKEINKPIKKQEIKDNTKMWSSIYDSMPMKEAKFMPLTSDEETMCNEISFDKEELKQAKWDIMEQWIENRCVMKKEEFINTNIDILEKSNFFSKMDLNLKMLMNGEFNIDAEEEELLKKAAISKEDFAPFKHNALIFMKLYNDPNLKTREMEAITLNDCQKRLCNILNVDQIRAKAIFFEMTHDIMQSLPWYGKLNRYYIKYLFKIHKTKLMIFCVLAMLAWLIS